MGKAVLVDQPFVSNQQINSIVVYEYVERLFVYYNLLGRKDEIRFKASGAAQPIMNKSDFGRLTLRIPDQPTQKRIAKVLGSLDDKIELNRQMNETLEEMARALFRDWFIDFGPTRRQMDGATDPAAIMGHAFLDDKAAALAPLFPERLGEDGLPDGWKMSSVGGYMEILDARRVPLSAREREKRVGPYPYHGATSVMGYVDDFLFDDVILLLGEDGSVIRTNGKPFTQYVWGKIWVNNHAHVLKGTIFSTEQLKVLFDHVDVAPYTTGAVQLKLNQKNMKSIPMIFASSKIHSEYDAFVLPLFAKLRASEEETQTLAEIRDLLLPKLMSGEIQLKDSPVFQDTLDGAAQILIMPAEIEKENRRKFEAGIDWRDTGED